MQVKFEKLIHFIEGFIENFHLLCNFSPTTANPSSRFADNLDRMLTIIERYAAEELPMTPWSFFFSELDSDIQLDNSIFPHLELIKHAETSDFPKRFGK